ncbi:protein of unknown function [Propionibacterium cyclohexanicum]|uniref:Uncharacterized protein n=1 Tax=Propionibacterium cyclohexanicum TaxID=64702 RepID=A0A1H9QD71_9ACTN|nr:DUF2017 domain-containing protein [Propionibacterium cyclohexanicum]SER58360.1 protein of unknown function [Propionibacterium cyclohexanicum]
MHAFRRRHGELTCTLEDAELTILAGLAQQLVELLTSEAMPPVGSGALTAGSGDSDADILGELEREFTDPVEGDFCSDEGVDPVLRRLFPDAYRDDPAAAAEFRRFSQAEQRDAKLNSAVVVIADLNQVGRDRRCVVSDEHVEDWLKTLTALRLALSVRLGITSSVDQDELAELPDADPRTTVFSIYEWLGWVQESLLDCLI